MSDDYADYLKTLDETHNPETVPEFGSHLPDGTYQARLDMIYIAKSKKEKIFAVSRYPIDIHHYYF